jgi:polygalacturonase
MGTQYLVKRCGLMLAVLAFFAHGLGAQDADWDKTLKTDLEKMAATLTANLKPWTVPATVFKVESYGAVADGTTVNTAAIQKAIDDCAGKGGGLVLFAKGDYVTGTIELKSGVMLEVALGARVLGSTRLADYPEKIEQFKSVMSENHQYRQSLIYAEKADKVGIRGGGEIYFRGEKENFPGPETIGATVGRPFGIRMIQCRSVVLQEITLRNSASWLQSYLDCRDLIFDGIRVENHANFNNDGLDPDGCTNLIIRNCIINAEDDAMCLKGCSGRPTQNVLIENSVFVSTCNALKIGTDTQGDFRNILCRHLKLGGVPEGMPSMRGHEASTGITLATVDGGNVENVLIQDVMIDRVRCPVFLRTGKRLRVMPGAPKPAIGYLKRILIDGVTGAENKRQGSLISGIAGKPVEDVIIRNYKIGMAGGGAATLAGLPVAEKETGYPDAQEFSRGGLPAFGFFIRHARNVRIEDAIVTPAKPDQRPQFVLGVDVENVIAK